jgi:hypothetical protein
MFRRWHGSVSYAKIKLFKVAIGKGIWASGRVCFTRGNGGVLHTLLRYCGARIGIHALAVHVLDIRNQSRHVLVIAMTTVNKSAQSAEEE